MVHFRKVKIEFEEVAGYPQLNTVHVWVEGEEITDGLQKAHFIKMLENF